jgi:Lon-like protease
LKRLQPAKGLEHRSGLAALAAVVAAVVASASLQVPNLALSPGPTRDVVELIRIEGAEPASVSGDLLMTTVSVRSVRAFQVVLGWLNPSTEIVGREAIIPRGFTREEADRRSSDQMMDSQVNAAAAALALLGYEVGVTTSGVRVARVMPDVPAFELLREGDVIVAADGQNVARVDDLVHVVGSQEVGEVVELHVRRGDDEITVETATVGRPENPTEPIIGIDVDDVRHFELPLLVDIDSLAIGGPSAGLMYAVGIVDLLDERDITRGRVVAGTGSIDFEGRLGMVGGVPHKVRAARGVGADLFLVPADGLTVACSVAGDLEVAGVDTLEDAVRALLDDSFARERGC